MRSPKSCTLILRQPLGAEFAHLKSCNGLRNVADSALSEVISSVLSQDKRGSRNPPGPIGRPTRHRTPATSAATHCKNKVDEPKRHE